jgi:hypothetical protein
MNFLFDNNLPKPLAMAINFLCKNNHNVVHLTDKFHHSTPDDEWLNALKVEGEWAIVTKDKNILKHPHIKAAWQEANLTTFFLTKGWSSFQFWVIAWKIIKCWPAIEDCAARQKQGTAIMVFPNGNLK